MAHSTKGTPSRIAALRPAGRTRFQDLFHSPYRGTFHRSLTVLVHYRSPWVFSLGSWATLLPTGFRVSGGTHAHDAPVWLPCHLQDSHLLRSAVPIRLGSDNQHRRRPCRIVPSSRSTPHQQRRQPRTLIWFGLLPVRSPLLRESSLFLGVREMFQFPRFPPPLARAVRCLQRGLPHSDSAGSPVASTSPARFAAWPRPSSAPGA